MDYITTENILLVGSMLLVVSVLIGKTSIDSACLCC